MSFGRFVCKLTIYEDILDVYSLEEILEMNDVTEEDLLTYLVEGKFIRLPTVKPLDFE